MFSIQAGGGIIKRLFGGFLVVMSYLWGISLIGLIFEDFLSFVLWFSFIYFMLHFGLKLRGNKKERLWYHMRLYTAISSGIWLILGVVLLSIGEYKIPEEDAVIYFGYHNEFLVYIICFSFIVVIVFVLEKFIKWNREMSKKDIFFLAFFIIIGLFLFKLTADDFISVSEKGIRYTSVYQETIIKWSDVEKVSLEGKIFYRPSKSMNNRTRYQWNFELVTKDGKKHNVGPFRIFEDGKEITESIWFKNKLLAESIPVQVSAITAEEWKQIEFDSHSRENILNEIENLFTDTIHEQ